MNAAITPRERANTNPPGSCQHGRTGRCTICLYDGYTVPEYVDVTSIEVPC